MGYRTVRANTQYLELPVAPVTAAPASMSVWGYYTDASLSQTLMSLGSSANGSFVEILLRPSSVVRLTANAAVSNVESAAGISAPNRWVHYGVVWAGTLATSRVYCNGSQVATGTMTASVPTSLDRLRLGYRASNTPTNAFDGGFAEAGVWDVELSPGEFAALARGIIPARIRPQSLKFYRDLRRAPNTPRAYPAAVTLNGGTGVPVLGPHPRRIVPFVLPSRIAALGGIAYSATITDALGLLDSNTPTVAWSQTATDALGLLDNAAPALDRAQTATDTLGVLDGASPALDRAQTVGDLLGITDANSPISLDIVDTQTDTLGLLDSVSTTLGGTVTLTDTIGLVDAVAPSVDRAATITDALGLLDDAAPALDRALTQTDTLGLVDSTSTAIGSGPIDYVATLTDTLGMTDSVSTTVAWVQTVTDVVGLTDSVVPTMARTQTLTDMLGQVDLSAPNMVRLVTIADTLGLLDSVSTTGTTTSGLAKTWDGSAWVAHTVKVWTGSAWSDAAVKFWTGSAWEDAHA